MSKKGYEGDGVRGLIPEEENPPGISSSVVVVVFSFLHGDESRSLTTETVSECLLGE
jgi:hypothetical protein